MHPDAPVTHPLLARRRSGILLHPTSLPGRHGSGDLGAHAHYFLDWLASARQGLWQVLPLTPPGPGQSPYQSPSAFAGSPWLIDLDELIARGWLDEATPPDFETTRCDFDAVMPYRAARLRQAWQGFQARASADERAELAAYAVREAAWLDDHALFMLLDARFGAPWTRWPAALARREPEALAAVAREAGAELDFWRFLPWCFDTQWARLRAAAAARGIALVGDLPLYVDHHSADVWACPDAFELDADGEPHSVAGVPPDYFSATGQRWGSPLYRWDAMAADGFAWWRRRLARTLSHVDLVRIDHFRGLEAFWAIPAHEPTAVGGHWRPGPGAALLDALRQGHDALPLIAEDLGIITPDVTALRERAGLPGMRVLQFAFGDDANNPYLPHNHAPDTVAYSGTHDNDTTLGWWLQAGEVERARVLDYLGAADEADMPWPLLHTLSASVARTLVLPFQDVLGLDGQHRMNTPGLAEGCWRWRFDWPQVGAAPAARLARMTAAHGRG